MAMKRLGRYAPRAAGRPPGFLYFLCVWHNYLELDEPYESEPEPKRPRPNPPQTCRVCGGFARVPFAVCNFCGDRPSWHHGRCCPARR